MKKFLFTAIPVLVLMACNQDKSAVNIGKLYAESDAFYAIVPKGAVVENIGVNFEFTEGPAWHRDGFLIFSDIPANKIYKMRGRKFEVFREPSGNSNGLLVKKDGSVIACEHGTRSLTEYSVDGELRTLADNFKGARLNSPNDLCKSSSGIIYFTDPSWGLPKRNQDPSKEIPFNGVYMIKNGVVSLIDSTLSWPNGIALSPGENFLYVSNFEPPLQDVRETGEVFWVRYEIDENGEPKGKTRFFDAPDIDLEGGPDGMKTDKNGNLFVTGPGGILIINQEGDYLGRIELPVPATNLAFGPKEKDLYITARSTVVKVNLK